MCRKILDKHGRYYNAESPKTGNACTACAPHNNWARVSRMRRNMTWQDERSDRIHWRVTICSKQNFGHFIKASYPLKSIRMRGWLCVRTCASFLLILAVSLVFALAASDRASDWRWRKLRGERIEHDPGQRVRLLFLTVTWRQAQIHTFWSSKVMVAEGEQDYQSTRLNDCDLLICCCN